MKNRTRSSTLALAIVASASGTPIKGDLNSIPTAYRKTVHGEFKGEKVNSPSIADLGGSVAIWPDANEKTVFQMGKAELGVLATDFLQSQGFTVTPAAA